MNIRKAVAARAGYSPRSVVEKLGVRENHVVWVVDLQGDYESLVGVMPKGVVLVNRRRKNVNMIHFFTTARSVLTKKFPDLKSSLAMDGSLWVSWPKGASGVQTDLNENIIREAGLEAGLVDVKVIAVDTTWSGLKFVYRKQDRIKR